MRRFLGSIWRLGGVGVVAICALSCFGCEDDDAGASADGAVGDGAVGEDGGRFDGGRDAAGDGAMADAGGDGGTVAGWWTPSPPVSWQWQLSDYPVDTSYEVEMYDVDLTDAAQSTIDELRSRGVVVICYFSAGSYEEWRDDAHRFPSEALGNELDGWEGERWVDITHPEVREIMVDRLELAASRGCDGVEPDNVDGYANENGLGLTAQDQLDYNRFLADAAHERGLSVGLKNDLDQIPALVSHFDWALNEECFSYDECHLLQPFIDAGKPVFNVEYGGSALADEICAPANALGFDTLVKNMDLDAWRISCR